MYYYQLCTQFMSSCILKCGLLAISSCILKCELLDFEKIGSVVGRVTTQASGTHIYIYFTVFVSESCVGSHGQLTFVLTY